MLGPDRPKKIPIERTSFRATTPINPFSFSCPSPSLLREKEKKEQVKQLEDYTQSILAGEKPFTQGKEKANNVLKGLVKEVKALCKEVAPTKETYAERLKRDLPSSSSLPSLLLLSLTFTPFFSRSSTSTRCKKKQL